MFLDSDLFEKYAINVTIQQNKMTGCNMIQNNETFDELSKDDLETVMMFMKDCLDVSSENMFHSIIMDFADYLGFEYVLYCYMKGTYDSDNHVNFVNLTFPPEWLDEYHRKNFLEHDPVRIEMERMLAEESPGSFIYWDRFNRPVSESEKRVIRRRNEYGFRYGCSVFDNNESKEFTFLITLGSGTNIPDKRTEEIMSTVISHLTVTRKKLNILQLTMSLSERESDVADWLSKGKTNYEISKILNISESTVKYHVSNIFLKLKVSNRSQAVALIIAARYLAF